MNRFVGTMAVLTLIACAGAPKNDDTSDSTGNGTPDAGAPADCSQWQSPQGACYTATAGSPQFRCLEYYGWANDMLANIKTGCTNQGGEWRAICPHSSATGGCSGGQSIGCITNWDETSSCWEQDDQGNFTSYCASCWDTAKSSCESGSNGAKSWHQPDSSPRQGC